MKREQMKRKEKERKGKKTEELEPRRAPPFWLRNQVEHIPPEVMGIMKLERLVHIRGDTRCVMKSSFFNRCPFKHRLRDSMKGSSLMAGELMSCISTDLSKRQ